MSSDQFPRLKEILAAALELSPEERISYLEEACGNDLELLREALAVLAYDTVDTNLPLSIPAFSSPELEPGDSFGQYLVIEKIGEGGLGVVFRARDTVLDRIVALKVLSPLFSSNQDRRQSFAKEARLVANLNHPQIVHVYGFGRERGLDYISMECVDGASLDKLTRGKAIPSGTVLKIGLSVALGLYHAHQRGIVHRDLKPANILFSYDGSIKIADFGLAHLLPGHLPFLSEESSSLVGWSDHLPFLAGTLLYMSPEQSRGEVPDARSDLFSLGTILYELSSGRHPFQGTDARDVLRRLQSVGREDLKSIDPMIDRDLSLIISKLMSPIPENRYEDASSLAADLKSAQEGAATDPQGVPIGLPGAEWTLSCRVRASTEPRPALTRVARITLRSIENSVDLDFEFDPLEYSNLELLLNDVFTARLMNYFTPRSYGSEWIVGNRACTVIAPLTWLCERHLQGPPVSLQWFAQVSPAQVGLTGGTDWYIATTFSGLTANPNDPQFAQSTLPSLRKVSSAFVTNNAEVAEVLRDSPSLLDQVVDTRRGVVHVTNLSDPSLKALRYCVINPHLSMRAGISQGVIVDDGLSIEMLVDQGTD